MNELFPSPDVQLELPPGIIDFRWGHPAASLLPAGDLARAAPVKFQEPDQSVLGERICGETQLVAKHL